MRNEVRWPGAGAGAGVDVGGTFTDVVLVDTDGPPRALKVPTTLHDQSEGVVDGLRQAYGKGDLATVAHGTTAATNAVLERAVARTVLLVTKGFEDVLEIGRQARPSLYDLTVTRRPPLTRQDLVVGVPQRTSFDGECLVELTDSAIDEVVERVVELEPAAIAISLLFSYVAPEDEERLARALRERLDVPITRSSVLLPEFREYERTSTCVLNAAVSPIMRRYLLNLNKRFENTTITVMTSGGGTAGLDFCAEAPVHTLLSGPAAGVVAAGAVARACGFDDALAFDMGGTSTDVCLIRGGQPEISTDNTLDGLAFKVPAAGIHTVGAGGGSIAWGDVGGALRVGPQSAGAQPGPACYGRGGTAATVTDAHCVLGHLDAKRELGGGLRLNVDAAQRALETLPEGSDAEGILTVVRATMVRALRRVSTERGVDPERLALVAYGGAGPLHATALARDLGCPAIIVPPTPGVFSALGLLLAPARYEASLTVMANAEDDMTRAWSRLEGQAREELQRQGVKDDVTLTRFADCRYSGQSHELRVELQGDEAVSELFHGTHMEAYGYAIRDGAVELVTARVVAQGKPLLNKPPVSWELGTSAPESERPIRINGQWVAGRIVQRASLSPGDEVCGPALIEQHDSTTLLGFGETAKVDEQHNLVVTFDV